MLDINYIRENRELVEKSAKEKGYKDLSITDILKLDDSRKSILQKTEELRKARNENAAKLQGIKGKPDQNLIDAGKKIKAELSGLEKQLADKEAELKTELKLVPNIIFDDVSRFCTPGCTPDLCIQLLSQYFYWMSNGHLTLIMPN